MVIPDATSSAPGDRPGDRLDGDHVDISLPLDTRYIATLRMLIASIAADAAFSVDEIDDLRLAISEIWSMMADRSTEGRLTARFSLDHATLTVQVALTGDAAAGALVVDELGANILDNVVDSYSIGHHDATITKRAAEVAAP